MKRISAVTGLALILAAHSPTAEMAQDRPSSTALAIQLVPGQGKDLARVAFEVTGLDAQALKGLSQARSTNDQWSDLFAVSVDPGDTGVLAESPRSPMAGRYEVKPNALRFIPQFPLDRGLRYRADFWPGRLPGGSTDVPGRSITAFYILPQESGRARARVLRLEPAVEVMPENLLRLYLHFSAPMSRGEAYQRLRLLDQTGQLVELAFLELGEELWDPAGQRLTLLIDPGRIKRGLVPNLEAGPVLEEGKQYTLVVDEAWPDAAGRPMTAGFRKSFRVGPAQREPIEPGQWQVTSPPGGSVQPVRLDFPEPLDRALATRLLRVLDGEGRPVPGRSHVAADATNWQFIPDSPWKPAEYQVMVGQAIEDLAGNRIGRAFEVDETEPITSRIITEEVAIPFRVAP